MFKYELHMHTKNCSRCGVNEVTEMLDAYKNRDYTGVVLTDHFFKGNSVWCEEGIWEWTERVKLFSECYYKAVEYGKKIGLDVFFGFENNVGGGREQLAYGVDERFLLNNPDIHQLPAKEFCKLVREYGGITSCAHPYRMANYIDANSDTYADVCDCVEIFNYGNADNEWNKKAYKLAKSLGKYFTSGSDAHSIEGVGYAGIATETKITSRKELVSAIKSDSTAIIVRDEIIAKSDLDSYFS